MQLTVVRERQHEIETQLQLQEQSLKAAQQTIRETTEHLERQRVRFDQLKAESSGQFQELTTVARSEALWEAVAFQLEESQQQIANISTLSSTPPELPQALHTLRGEIADERMSWLRRLEDLHQQCEKLDTQVQNARNLETTRFQELDEARRRFQSVRERIREAQNVLSTQLTSFTSSEELADALTDITAAADETTDEDISTSTIVEQIASAVNAYRQLIDALENDLTESIDTTQGELSDLQILVGGKQQEIADFQEIYQRKQAEAEYTPTRSDRRQQARSRLAEQGIPSLPLYALLAFTPDLNEEDAGRIEQMLEDAGLLDALVVPLAQTARADHILAAEDLSDCRLDLETIQQHYGSASDNNTASQSLALRLDPILSDSTAVNWQDTANIVLAVLQPYLQTQQTTHRSYSMDRAGNWTHGLLTGHAGSAFARYIGQETRIRARKRELAELEMRKAELEGELAEIIIQLTSYEKQIEELQLQQAQLRKVFSKSGLEDSYAALTQTRHTLDTSRDKYQKAHQQTQDMRQRYNALRVQLERSGEGNQALIGDAKQVQTALLAMIKLKNQGQTTYNQLNNVIHTWNECQSGRITLERAQLNTHNVASLYERVRTQALQIQAEQAELQHIAATSNVEELSQRLHLLRERNSSLSTELETSKLNYVRVDERAQNVAATLTEIEAQLQLAQQVRQEKQGYFAASLIFYPVEQLARVQQAIDKEQYPGAAQLLLGELQPEDDNAARKNTLEAEYRDAYSALARVFNHEQSILLEYGPDMDDQG